MLCLERRHKDWHVGLQTAQPIDGEPCQFAACPKRNVNAFHVCVSMRHVTTQSCMVGSQSACTITLPSGCQRPAARSLSQSEQKIWGEFRETGAGNPSACSPLGFPTPTSATGKLHHMQAMPVSGINKKNEEDDTMCENMISRIIAEWIDL